MKHNKSTNYKEELQIQNVDTKFFRQTLHTSTHMS